MHFGGLSLVSGSSLWGRPVFAWCSPFLPGSPESVFSCYFWAHGRQQELARLSWLFWPQLLCSLTPTWVHTCGGWCLEGWRARDKLPCCWLHLEPQEKFPPFPIISGTEPHCRKTDFLFREEERWGLVRKNMRWLKRKGERESKKRERQKGKQSVLAMDRQGQISGQVSEEHSVYNEVRVV